VLAAEDAPCNTIEPVFKELRLAESIVENEMIAFFNVFLYEEKVIFE